VTERSLDVLSGVVVRVSAHVGSCKMPISDVLNLGAGSLIQLDRAAGEVVDLLVNGTPIARGEIVAIGDRYGLRITEVVGNS
jgi:flagellar motor switch protein FliN/FliY